MIPAVVDRRHEHAAQIHVGDASTGPLAASAGGNARPRDQHRPAPVQRWQMYLEVDDVGLLGGDPAIGGAARNCRCPCRTWRIRMR